MNWEPDPDLGEPVNGVNLERRPFDAVRDIYDYRVVVRREDGESFIAATSRDGREAIGMAYWAARATAAFFRKEKIETINIS